MTHYLTRDGLEKLKKELTELKTVKRKAVIERIQAARELGDLSENAEYADAREEQSFMEGRIMELEKLINESEVINDNGGKNEEALIGSTIIVSIDCGQEKQYTIVGSNEANPLKGLISNESPIGKAFLGKKVGDDVEVKTPMGSIIYKITKIS